MATTTSQLSLIIHPNCENHEPSAATEYANKVEQLRQLLMRDKSTDCCASPEVDQPTCEGAEDPALRDSCSGDCQRPENPEPPGSDGDDAVRLPPGERAALASYQAAGVFGSRYLAAGPSAMDPDSRNAFFIMTVAPDYCVPVPIPDLNMTQSLTKTVTGSETLTPPVTADYLFVCNLYSSNQDRWVQVWVRPTGSGQFSFLRSLPWSQVIASDYDLFRHAASRFRIKSTTWDGGSSNLSGVISAVNTQSPVDIPNVNQSVIQSLGSTNSSNLNNVSLKDGVIVITPPFGDYEFSVPELSVDSTPTAGGTLTTSVRNESPVISSKYEDRGTGPFTVPAAAMITGFDTNVLGGVSSILPFNTTSPLGLMVETPVTYAAGVTSIVALTAITRQFADGATFLPSLVDDIVGRKTFQNLDPAGGVINITQLVTATDFAGTDSTRPITRIRSTFTATGGNVSINPAANSPLVASINVEDYYGGNKAPTSLVLVQGVPSGMAFTIDALAVLEVVPDENLIKDVKIDVNIEDPFAMELAEAGWASCKKLGFAPVMDLPSYDHFVRDKLPMVSTNRALAYHASGVGDFLRSAWNFFKPAVGAAWEVLRPAAIEAGTGAISALGTMASENPMIGALAGQAGHAALEEMLPRVPRPIVTRGRYRASSKRARTIASGVRFTASGKETFTGSINNKKFTLNAQELSNLLTKENIGEFAMGLPRTPFLNPTRFVIIPENQGEAAVLPRLSFTNMPGPTSGPPIQIPGSNSSVSLPQLIVGEEAAQSVIGAIRLYESLLGSPFEVGGTYYLVTDSPVEFSGPSLGLACYASLLGLPAQPVYTGDCTGGVFRPVAELQRKILSCFQEGMQLMFVEDQSDLRQLRSQLMGNYVIIDPSGLAAGVANYKKPVIGFAVDGPLALQLACRLMFLTKESRKTLAEAVAEATRPATATQVIPAVDALTELFEVRIPGAGSFTSSIENVKNDLPPEIYNLPAVKKYVDNTKASLVAAAEQKSNVKASRVAGFAQSLNNTIVSSLRPKAKVKPKPKLNLNPFAGVERDDVEMGEPANRREREDEGSAAPSAKRPRPGKKDGSDTNDDGEIFG